LPYPRQDQQKRGDGKPPPYGGPVIDGLGFAMEGLRNVVSRALGSQVTGSQTHTRASSSLDHPLIRTTHKPAPSCRKKRTC